jgi:hypothetical protein
MAKLLDPVEWRTVTIPAKDWEALKHWMDRPAEEIEALKELVSRVRTRRERNALKQRKP